MHKTAMLHGKLFFDTYAKSGTVLDIGSQDVNGSLREVCPPNIKYIGVDFVHAKGVDIVLTDPYKLPIDSESIDYVVCSSCFEHSEFFWLTFLEIMRVLKPSGVFYLNVPSNGAFHRYPVDCWRFYPDSGKALANWAKRNGYNAVLLESFIGKKMGEVFCDFVSVFIKDESKISEYPERILSRFDDFENGYVFGCEDIINFELEMEETRRLFNAIHKKKKKPKSFLKRIFK